MLILATNKTEKVSNVQSLPHHPSRNLPSHRNHYPSHTLPGVLPYTFASMKNIPHSLKHSIIGTFVICMLLTGTFGLCFTFKKTAICCDKLLTTGTFLHFLNTRTLQRIKRVITIMHLLTFKASSISRSLDVVSLLLHSTALESSRAEGIIPAGFSAFLASEALSWSDVGCF